MSPTGQYEAVAERTDDALVMEHATLVKRIAYHLVSRMPSNVDVEDLIQAGMIGLLEAARNYSPDGGANFATFAGIRIRGAMLDEVRRLDWTPRSVHRRVRELTQVVRELENRIGRDARDSEIAAEMGIELEDYHALLQDASNARLCSLDQLAGDGDAYETIRSDEPEPLEGLQKREFFEQLVAQIGALPEREKLVMSLYYEEELNLREIGEVLGVSESRVCQIHGQAMLRLRARLGEWQA